MNTEKKLDISPKERPLFFLLLFLPVLVKVRPLDNDLWFLLNSGRHVLEHGIPYLEPFTIHQGFEFMMQQWLSACLFWLTYSAFGEPGLILLVMLVYAAVIWMIYRLCMKISGNYFFVSFAVTMLAAVFLKLIMVSRPAVFSTLLLTVHIYLLECYADTSDKRYLFALPILSVLLINLHAAIWPMQFILLLPYLIDSFRFKIGFISGQGYEKKALFLVMALMLAAGFLNPYGLDAMTYLTRSYGHPEISNLVMEMLPPNINTLTGKLVYAIIAGIILTYALYRKGATRLRYALLTAGTLYMMLSSVRSISFFLICGFFPLAYYLRDFTPKVKQQEASPRTLLLRKILTAVVLLTAVYMLYDTVTREKLSPENILLRDALLQMQTEGDTAALRLYTGYNDGGMAEFMGIPAYIDPRAEVFIQENNKQADILEEYVSLLTGRVWYKDFLDKYNFTHLLVTKDDPLYVNLGHDGSYQLFYENEKYFLFKRMEQ